MFYWNAPDLYLKRHIPEFDIDWYISDLNFYWDIPIFDFDQKFPEFIFSGIVPELNIYRDFRRLDTNRNVPEPGLSLNRIFSQFNIVVIIQELTINKVINEFFVHSVGILDRYSTFSLMM